jgi:rifampicin phosphotransferase
MAASPGQVTGRARVVMSPAEASTLQPGDILVTRATDPGWTPVFSIIGGAVLEIGGTLSHGAIIAREYGLPAVVNVSQATQRIRDGQIIRVDGASGRITLID